MKNFKKTSLIAGIVILASFNSAFSQTTIIDGSGTNNGTNPLTTGTSGLLRFGASTSGEAIGSNRTSTLNPNRYGLDFYTASVRYMSLTGGGFLGINTADPKSRLHVIGNIQLDGDQSSNYGNPQIKSTSTLNFYPDIDGTGDCRIRFYSRGTNPSEIFTIDENTNVGVGIGSTLAKAKLQVNGGLNLSGTAIPSIAIDGLTAGYNINYTWIQSTSNKPLLLNPLSDATVADPSDLTATKTKSFVGIGFSNTLPNVPKGYSLAVKGKIITEGLRIKSVSSWADYVFDKDYKLMELSDVEKFVTENKHLPEIPSEKEVKENGLDTEQIQMLLLKKIEELTLYIIEQDKKIKLLQEASQK